MARKSPDTQATSIAPSPAHRPKSKAEREVLRSILAEARAAFDQDTPEARKKRRARAQDDFPFFCTTYLPHYFSQPPAAFHRLLIEMALNHDRVAVAAPRGHAKSTVMSFAFPLWAVLTGRKKFICVFSANARLAGSFLASIREELEYNHKIIGDFGDVRGGPPWSARALRLKDGQRIRSFGRGEGLRGVRNRQYRPDLIICDDLEDDEKVESKTQRDKLEDWFFKALVNTLDPAGSLIVVGTLLHDDSLLARLLENPLYASRLWKAVQPDGTSLWPERWPIEKLEALKNEIGPLRFEQEYQNNPAREGLFRREWIRYYRPEELDGKALDLYMAIDPAISERTTADYFAIVVLGVDRKTGDIYVLAAYHQRLSALDQIEKICEYWMRFRAICVGIETVAYQKALKQFLDDRSKKERLYIPTREVKHDSDKTRRIMTLSPLVELGVLHFTESQEALVDELLMFPRAAHDDLADALETAVSLARQGGIEFKVLHCRPRTIDVRVSTQFLGTKKVNRREMFAGYGL